MLTKEREQVREFIPSMVWSELVSFQKNLVAEKFARNEFENFVIAANMVKEEISEEEFKLVTKKISKFKTIEDLTDALRNLVLEKLWEEKHGANTMSWVEKKFIENR